MRRHLACLLTAFVAITTLAACGEGVTNEDRVLKALRDSQNRAARYVYTSTTAENVIDGTPARQLEVKGVEEDDFRYKARVAIDGVDRYDEVIYDDALAMRFIDPGLLPRFLNKAAGAPLKTSVDGLSVIDALRTRRWVVDPEGAPAPVAARVDASKLGIDPVVDGRSALAYAEQAVKEALSVRKWDPEATQPAYLAFEDNFPKPEEGSGVARYDLVRPPLPPPGNINGTGEANVPSTRHFRKMAIYVKDGRVIQLREDVSLQGKVARDFAKYMRSFLREANAPEEAMAGYDTLIEEAPSDEELGFGLLAMLNIGLGIGGQSPVLVRTMSYDLQETEAITVELPTEEAIEASLAVLTVSGHNRPEAGQQGGEGGGGAGTAPAGSDAPAADGGAGTAPAGSDAPPDDGAGAVPDPPG